VNFGAVNHSDIVARLQKECGCTHAKIRTFALFPQIFINFQQM